MNRGFSKFGVTAGASALCVLSACSFRSTPPEMVRGGNVSTVVVHQPINELERDPVPGTVNDAWAETMIDTVEVPGKLDPNGVFYIPPHKTLVEIRHGRYQKVQFPDEYGKDGYVLTPGAETVVTPQGLQQK